MPVAEIAEPAEGLLPAGHVRILDRADNEAPAELRAEGEQGLQRLGLQVRQDRNHADLEQGHVMGPHELADPGLHLGVADDVPVRGEQRVEAQTDGAEATGGGSLDLPVRAGVENGEGGKGKDRHGRIWTMAGKACRGPQERGKITKLEK